MSDDFMRLCDLVPRYARFHKISPQEAAYALYELIERLYVEYGVNRFLPHSVNDVFWVGCFGSHDRSPRTHVIYFQELSKYFYELFCSPSRGDKNKLSCYCEEAQRSIDVPDSVIYFSGSVLVEWILNAGFESPDFLLSTNLAEKAKGRSDGGLNEQELGTVIKIVNGLVDIIKAVDKAHRESPTNYDDKVSSSNIKRYACTLSNPPRKNSDVCSTLIALAEEAGVDMPSYHGTMRKYMGIQSKSDTKA
ncbi:hypothetical protein [Pseudomonas asiatica]|uniref:Uncharacterized protein n=1 Tax=Pseudomonas asiatica TaxID=2219225 RepID=A0ABU5KWQ5_9PSED|nr:hypothetical protein [Pseudomonas asiatica]MDZ5738337.1 hypothetical protein [Pseudomonas asiatica]MDZ5742961.1 hypothetical protein [Pseudomonas asiatica]MDZ5748547.1 hypothetical protein [Pseudomonas asiatica]MDZ5753425.1 hypothetical protein [Pseudomonas asiatica]